MNIILLLVGLGLIVLGADWLVDGASAIARRAGVSEFVIGLTIVGFGTSCPELVVSLTGAIQGNADIAIGNVVGSNIFNALFILGLTALLMSVSMTDANRKRDIPITLSVSLLLICFGMSRTLFGIGAADSISRFEGIAFLLIFGVDYDTYYSGAKYLSWLLTPATVCLAVPLYEQIDMLKENRLAILLGIAAGVLTSLGSVLIFALLMKLDHCTYVTLLPKSVTTAIGVAVSEELGGYPAITVAVIVLTGITGNVLAEGICRVFRITEPVAKGIWNRERVACSGHGEGNGDRRDRGGDEQPVDRRLRRADGRCGGTFRTVYLIIEYFLHSKPDLPMLKQIRTDWA